MTVEDRRLQLTQMALSLEGQKEFVALLRKCPGKQDVTGHAWIDDLSGSVEAVLRDEFGGLYEPRPT